MGAFIIRRPALDRARDGHRRRCSCSCCCICRPAIRPAIIAGDNATPANRLPRSASSSVSMIRCTCSSGPLGRSRVLQGDLGISIFSNEPVRNADRPARLSRRSRWRSPRIVLAVALAVGGRRARRLEGQAPGSTAWSDGPVGDRLLRTGVRGRLPADLRVRRSTCAGCRCRAIRRSREGFWPWIEPPDPALDRARAAPTSR